jgi:hypothetical protein
VLARSELPAEVQHRLVWRVAAALRAYLVATQSIAAGDADRAIARAASAALAGYDEGEALPALAVSLARALQAAGQLDGALIEAALVAGHVTFAVAGLGVRAGIGADVAWDIALDPDGLLLLCRAANVSRHHAAGLVLRLAHDGDDERLAERLDEYDVSSPAAAAAAIDLWRLDPAYLDSIAALAGEAAR